MEIIREKEIEKDNSDDWKVLQNGHKRNGWYADGRQRARLVVVKHYINEEKYSDNRVHGKQ